MNKIITYIKTHFTLILVIVLFVYIFLPKNNSSPIPLDYGRLSKNSVNMQDNNLMYAASPAGGGMPESFQAGIDRKVQENFNIDATVKSVGESIKFISSKVETLGGFVVSSNFSKPNDTENGYISVRIPKDKRNDFEDFVKKEAIQVISQSTNSQDITDNYSDNQKRLAILEKNKDRFEQIMQSATDVTEILKVQREIFNLQSEIDSLLGQKEYMDRTSSTILYSVNLSTDPYAFSYLPYSNWNPQNIFKEAVRSLVLSIRGFAAGVIWILVYSVIWLPIVLITLFMYSKYWKRKIN